MAWSRPWSRKPDASPVDAADTTDDAWARHVTALAAQGVAEPGSALGRGRRRPGTQGDHAALHGVAPACADLDRKSVAEGKRVSVRVDIGGGRYVQKKKNNTHRRRRPITDTH